MMKKIIYLAGPLFTMAQSKTNEDLAGYLSSHFDVILPQRDGFNFYDLNEKLTKKYDMNRTEADRIGKNMIAYLDKGLYIPKSDVIVANMDEPLDPGTIDEVIRAKGHGLPIIAYRTDARHPFGDDHYGGIHTFMVHNIDHFILGSPASRPHEISQAIRNISMRDPEKQTFNDQWTQGADILYKGLSNFKNGNLDRIVQNYLNNRDLLEKIEPNVIRI